VSGSAPVNHIGEDTGFEKSMSSKLDVIQNGHSFEKFDILKSTCNAQFGNAVGRNTENVLTLVQDLTFLRRVESADAIEQAGFTGPVGSNDSGDFAA